MSKGPSSPVIKLEDSESDEELQSQLFRKSKENQLTLQESISPPLRAFTMNNNPNNPNNNNGRYSLRERKAIDYSYKTPRKKRTSGQGNTPTPNNNSNNNNNNNQGGNPAPVNAAAVGNPNAQPPPPVNNAPQPPPLANAPLPAPANAPQPPAVQPGPILGPANAPALNPGMLNLGGIQGQGPNTGGNAGGNAPGGNAPGGNAGGNAQRQGGLSTAQCLGFLSLLLFIWLALIGLIPISPGQPGGPDDDDPAPGIEAGDGREKGPWTLLGQEKIWEPLPVFYDITALYRSWATFSTWSPFDTSVAPQQDDQIDFEPIFSNILELGDMYDLNNGQFIDTDAGVKRRDAPREDLENLGSEDKVDIVHLEHRVVESIHDLQEIFRKPSSQTVPADWISHVEHRLSNLKTKTKADMGRDRRFFIFYNEPDWHQESWMMSGHLNPVEHIRYLKETPTRHPGHGKLEEIVVGIEGSNQLNEMMQQLLRAKDNMDLVDLIAAHSSTEYLYGATRGPKSAWGFLQLFAAPYGETDPLRKAVRQAEDIHDISEEREIIARMSQQIDGLVDGLSRIIDCERAIDRHLDVLESTSTTLEGKRLSDGYLSYVWDASNEGWLTERKKKAPFEERTHKDLGQRECMSLFDFKRGRPSEQFPDLKPDGEDATEMVLQFVPASRYLHAKYKKDMEFIQDVSLAEES